MGQEMKLAPIRLDSYQPLREVVAEALRDAIKSGTLAPGQRLMEIQLAEELGVSRTPVREAIRKLELEGYVVMMPRRGTYVASLSIRDVNDVFEIRTALDSLACALAAERITENELESLQRLLVAIGGHIEAGDMEKIVETDMRFHDLLYQASRNTRLVGIISNLREQLTRFRSASMSFPGRLKEAGGGSPHGKGGAYASSEHGGGEECRHLKRWQERMCSELCRDRLQSSLRTMLRKCL